VQAHSSISHLLTETCFKGEEEQMQPQSMKSSIKAGLGKSPLFFVCCEMTLCGMDGI
jgi:hypothetical protein